MRPAHTDVVNANVSVVTPAKFDLVDRVEIDDVNLLLLLVFHFLVV